MNELKVILLKDKYHIGISFPKGTITYLDLRGEEYIWIHGYGDYEVLKENIDYKIIGKKRRCSTCDGSGIIYEKVD